jgi:nucleoside-diphosphate-sugar epimerase
MKSKKVLITGGAGYVGSRLVELLVKNSFKVIVYDTFWYRSVLSMKTQFNHSIECICGDIRDFQKLEKAMANCSSIIHLACISNDPSFDLNPDLGKSINFSCFEEIVRLSVKSEIKQFIFASSSSVYGIKEDLNVTEVLPKEPITDYSKFKSECEEILLNYSDINFCTTILRPATVCGVSKRQRLDVIVNILTNHAISDNEINIFNGPQKRPNIHIDDMCQAYLEILNADYNIINGQIYNVGSENLTVSDIANKVSKITKVDNINIVENNDQRSYHISSDKIFQAIGFSPKKTVEDAISDLQIEFKKNIYTDSLNNELYFNVKFLSNHNIS